MSGWSTRLLAVLLKHGGVRRRVAFHLKQHHFADLNLRLPIGEGLVCRVGAEDDLMSFGEIFCEREYDALFQHVPLPRRWLDVGAHAGYFSLFTAAQLVRSGVENWGALLIEPDPRLHETIAAGIAQPRLHGRAELLRAAVGPTGGAVPFVLRGGMVSSLDPSAGAAMRSVDVPVATAAEIIARFPPPYDLVKVDVEGAEYEFARNYGEVCQGARAMVVEWHAPTADAPCVAELRASLGRHGLTEARALRGLHTAAAPGPLAVTGLELFTRPGAGAPR